MRRFLAGRNFAFLSSIISSGRIHGIIQFLIDTGSPFTAISPRDAMRFRVRLRGRESVRLAGFRFFKIPLGESSFTLRTEDDNAIKLTSSCLTILEPTRSDRRTIGEVQSIPSILGTEFLEEQGAALYFDPSRIEAYLELQ